MTFTLKIECNNEAFGCDPSLETARILRRAAEWLDSHVCDEPIMRNLLDTNGNRVGFFGFDQ